MNYTDRCGVCKDIAGTLVSFLRMAGFEAYPAMTMAGSRVESIPADHFNHCVAVVKLADGTYMPLDPTWVPFCRELWSSAEQQQNYLPGVPEGSDLCLTPVSAPENHYVRIKADNRLDAMVLCVVHLPFKPRDRVTAIYAASLQEVFRASGVRLWKDNCWLFLLKPDC